MLNIIKDTRCGTRLEIVIFVFNESSRIRNFLQCYSGIFDLVIMDDGSTDDTVQIAIEGGASVFHREDKAPSPEEYFVKYINSLSKSGRAILLFSDEFVTIEALYNVAEALEGSAGVVLARRVNYLFAKRTITFDSIGPRAFTAGGAIHDPTSLHAQLLIGKNCKRHSIIADIHHLHLTKLSAYYGTAGTYVAKEVALIKGKKWPRLKFIRRFAGNAFSFLILKSWRERNMPILMILYLVIEKFVHLLLALLSWIDIGSLPSLSEQLEVYNAFYAAERKLYSENFEKIRP